MPDLSDSPFLNGYQYAFDSTSLGWLKDCPRKYFYAMLEGWRPVEDSPHLRFGQEYHTAGEEYEKLRASPDIDSSETNHHDSCLRSVINNLLIRTRDWNPSHKYKNKYNLVRTVIWYLDQFGPNDPAQTLILDNGKPALELSFRLPVGDDLMYCGHLDRVVTYQGHTYVTDKKTTSHTVGSYFFEQYDLDAQMTGYIFAGRIIFQMPVRGIIIEGTQIAIDFTRIDRGMTYRTDGQLEEWLDDLKYWAFQAKALAAAGYYPKNETSCNKYRSNDPTAEATGCVFRGICSKDPSVRQTFLESDFKKSFWNPVASR